jgi:outer membrane protein OmpA-like peptidoglycan-associated protein
MKLSYDSLRSDVLVGATLPLLLALGCATTQTPQSLLDARKAYQVAESGEAAKYAPDQLLEAQKLLADAENSRPASDEQEHLAYLADRQARFAQSQGELEMNEARLGAAQQRYIALQDQRRTRAESGLEDTRRNLLETRKEMASINEKLQSKDANLDELNKRRTELERQQNQLEQQLDVQGVALTQSEKAREAAEGRASAAIASLTALAQVKEEANETIVTLSGAVLFKTGKAELLPLAENALDQVAAALKQLDESQTVVIAGHTDSRGADDMNRQLSQKRAEAVRTYLVQQGVNASKLKAVGKGEGSPVASNDTAEGRANNRRVEMIIGKPR